MVTLPELTIVIVYIIVSSSPIIPSALSSFATADFVTLISGSASMIVIVGSSVVFPSVSSPLLLITFSVVPWRLL